MPQIQTTTYKCDHCGATASIEYNMMGGAGAPAGWQQIVSVMGAATNNPWFDKWECIRDYAAERSAAAA